MFVLVSIKKKIQLWKYLSDPFTLPMPKVGKYNKNQNEINTNMLYHPMISINSLENLAIS